MTHTTTPTAVIDVGPRRSADSVRTGGAGCALGGLVLAAGGIATQVTQASTSVSDQVWHYPWSSRTAVVAWVIFGTASALVLAGVLAWRRSGAAGSSRAARIGIPLAAIGTLLIVAGHFASIPVRNQTIHDTGAQLVSVIFAAGTVLSAAGLLLAGWATLRADVWQDWRRFVPLGIGVVTAALIGVQFTEALPTAVTVYALGFIAFGLGLMRRA